jgi:uncharacterized protein (TIGR00255 family)
MTGYGTAARELPHGALSLEIKGVNSRFLDTVFRLNDELRALEPPLREMVAAAVTRGKVEVRLGYGREATRAVRPLAINAEMVARLGQAAAEVRRMVADAAPLTTREILDWPGVLEDASLPQETLRATAMELARLALAEWYLKDRRILDAALAFESAARELKIPLKVVRDTCAGGREDFEARLMLIRPDQHVAWASDQAAADAGAILRRVAGRA